MEKAKASIADDPRERIFLIHQFKTGGTSLYGALAATLPPRSVYPRRDDGDPFFSQPQADVGTLLTTWARDASEILVFSGHFSHSVVRSLGHPFAVVTVLRDPVDRVLSHLRQQRQISPEFRDHSLEAIYDDDSFFLRFLDNHMVRMLSIGVDELTDGVATAVPCTRQRVEAAKEALDTMAMFGVTEDYASFWHRFVDRFGYDLGPVRWMNRSPEAAVPESLRRRIAEENQGDLDLYEHALHQLARRR